MNHNRFILAITAGALLFLMGQGTRAKAQLIVQTETLTATAADFDGKSLTPSINRFNPALGTLTEVDILWEVGSVQGGNVTNLGNSPQTFTINSDTKVNLSEQSNGSGSLFSPNIHTQQTYTNLPANVPTAYGNFVITLGDLHTYTDAATEAFFSGAGTLNLFATATTSLSIVGGSNIQLDLSDSITGKATIEYMYRPVVSSVPEPGSISFFAGLGITGSLFGFRRLRKS